MRLPSRLCRGTKTRNRAARPLAVARRPSLSRFTCDMLVVAGVAHLRVLVRCWVFALARLVVLMRLFPALTLGHFELLRFEAPAKP